tara:strand:+ start:593 stop:736 length:144 start_codon:yes stop_codon:yes gene_type:complete
MDNDHLFLLSNVVILGDLFFFTNEALKKEDKLMNQLIGDLYKDISFN